MGRGWDRDTARKFHQFIKIIGDYTLTTLACIPFSSKQVENSLRRSRRSLTLSLAQAAHDNWLLFANTIEVKVGSNIGVGEDGLRLGQNILRIVAAADMMQH